MAEVMFEQIMDQMKEIRGDLKDVRRDLAAAIQNQNTASIQGVKLLAEHDICRGMVQDHDRAIKGLQKFKIQIITVAATIQFVVGLIVYLLEKAMASGVGK